MILVVSLVINFFDYLIINYFCLNFIEKRSSLSSKSFIVGILYGIFLGLMSFYLDSVTFQIIVIFTSYLIIKWITGKRIVELLLLYVVINLCTVCIQVLFITIVSNLPLDFVYSALLSQTLTLILIIYLCKKTPLYIGLAAIEKQIVLKLFVFTIFIMYIILSSYFSFDYIQVEQSILYFIILMSLTSIGFYDIIKKIIFFTNIIPMQLHDTKNILMGVQILLQSTSDIERVRSEFNKSLELMSIDMGMHINIDEDKENIDTFINYKKLKSKKELLFLTDICFYEANIKVPLSIIVYMLGVLLDNSIECQPEKPILIKLRVSQESLEISVANECETIPMGGFERMFKKGYTTKENITSGYGLYNLKKVVAKYGGEILIRHNYNEEHKSYYLTIIIEVKE